MFKCFWDYAGEAEPLGKQTVELSKSLDRILVLEAGFSMDLQAVFSWSNPGFPGGQKNLGGFLACGETIQLMQQERGGYLSPHVTS